MAESTLVIRAAQDAGATVHWLPVKTNHSGPCKVDEFFQPQLIEGKQGSYAGVAAWLISHRVQRLQQLLLLLPLRHHHHC